MSKKNLVRLVPEGDVDNGTAYYVKKPTKGPKVANKLRMMKYDPVIRKHRWFIEKKLPSPKK